MFPRLKERRGNRGRQEVTTVHDRKLIAIAPPFVRGPSGTLSIPGSGYGSYVYFGAAYPAGTRTFDNIADFFQTGATQKHNLAFSGGAADNRVGYRISASSTTLAKL